MVAANILSFFKNGGVFLFDEENAASEATYYKVENLMGETKGESITEIEVDEEGLLCIFYDGEVMDDEQAKTKYAKGEYVKSI
ncbi:MAG: hypothetical protein K8R77_16595 [Anaerolineaceae bacterium]|nr:hypothetical protein [Anaerolineaceae bacterium]